MSRISSLTLRLKEQAQVNTYDNIEDFLTDLRYYESIIGPESGLEEYEARREISRLRRIGDAFTRWAAHHEPIDVVFLLPDDYVQICYSATGDVFQVCEYALEGGIENPVIYLLRVDRVQRREQPVDFRRLVGKRGRGGFDEIGGKRGRRQQQEE
jgi:hypothetical protein